MVKKLNSGGQGGYRAGAGRPKGTGRYGETTRPVRIPVSLLSEVEALIASRNAVMSEGEVVHLHKNNVYTHPTALPLYSNRVAAGFPSPADDHIERHLDLNEHLIERPAATFFVRVEGESMIGAGIHPNDILIVDRSMEVTNGKIVIAVVNGELTVKRLKKSQGRIFLWPENPRFKALEITEEMDFRIWGVVVHVIHSL